MSTVAHHAEQERSRAAHRPIAVGRAGTALSLFMLVTYALAAVAYVLAPQSPFVQALLREFMPGVTSFSWATLALGGVVAIAWGWYVALVAVPLFNYFLARR
ncbi:hypothetical protein [Cognatilysobacter lacus]|uniref:Uncharacterized protein n=1 Tax=Cognatilysobacter lacus TaxID=1643323 RepID=A0A5D8Z5T1_9GAMM|nr:hypothetical protein [Lysobacter lacus]TZF90010.1 hypothetical protein FW784_07015 [Lysobacter lacus]